MNKKKLKILMTAAEVSPFAKVGGLADVAGSLPKELIKKKIDVRVIMPLYGRVDRKKYKLKKVKENISLISGNKIYKYGIWRAFLPGTKVIIYFIENKEFFGEKEVYYISKGKNKNKNSERFLFFSLASLSALKEIDFIPELIHCHDYHTALIIDMIKASNAPLIKNIKTLYTIHNLNYQGISDVEVLTTGNLSKNSLKSLSKDAQDKDINFMVQGILNANIINTVSKKYSKEILKKDYGAHLDNILRKRKNDLYGVVNGIDMDVFNPSQDNLILEKYNIKSISKKVKNKLFLQNAFNLPQNKNIALAGLVSRFFWQKGLDLFTKEIAQLPCQFVFLGTGDPKIEEKLLKLAKKYPEKISLKLMFDVKLAQQVYAGSDIFLMPSRYEPCGLGQMIAMRYGTLPVARSTGGLDDTIDSSLGFKFSQFNQKSLMLAIKKALAIYYKQPEKWKKMQKNAMKKDFSWKKSSEEYIKLYKKALESK